MDSEDIKKIKIGSRIVSKHAYGLRVSTGTVIDVDEDEVRIHWDSGSRAWIHTSFLLLGDYRFDKREY